MEAWWLTVAIGKLGDTKRLRMAESFGGVKRKPNNDGVFRPAPGLTSACGAWSESSTQPEGAQPADKRARVDISDAEQHHSDAPQIAIAALLAPPLSDVETNGDWLFGLCKHHVSGGFLDALMVESPPEGGYWIRTFQRSSGPGSHPFNVNAVRKVHGGWRSCSLRLAGQSVSSKGVFSIWRKEDTYMVAYRDALVVTHWLGEHGSSISNSTRNRIMHALNGNIRYWVHDRDFYDSLRISEERAVFVRSVYAAAPGTTTQLDVGIMEQHAPPGPRAPWNEWRSLGPNGAGAGSGNQPDGPAATWSISNAARNRAMHALNGNTSRKPDEVIEEEAAEGGREADRQKKFLYAYNTVHETRKCECGRNFKVYVREHLKQRKGANLGLQWCPSCRAMKASLSRGEDWVDDVEIEEEVPAAALEAAEEMGCGSSTAASEGDHSSTVGKAAPCMASVKGPSGALMQMPKKKENKRPAAAKDDEQEAAERKAKPDGPIVRQGLFDTAWRSFLPIIYADSGYETHSTHGARGFGNAEQGGVPIVLLAGECKSLLEDNKVVYYITKRFANFDGAVFGIDFSLTLDFSFVRLGRDLWRHQNWLYGTATGGFEVGNCKIASMDVEGETLDCWKLWRDDAAPGVVADNTGKADIEGVLYRWYLGSDRTTIFRDGIRHDVRRSLWQQASRFFSGPQVALNAAAQVTGALKANEELSGADIDCMIVILSRNLRDRAPHVARVLSGDRGAWNEVKDCLNGCDVRKPWWLPKTIWHGVSPYRAAWSDEANALLCLTIIYGSLLLLSIVVHMGGLINFLAAMDRVLIGGGSWASYILVTARPIAEVAAEHVVNATTAGATVASNAANAIHKEYFDYHTPNMTMGHYVVRGSLADSMLWFYLGDRAAGDRISRAHDSAGPIWELLARWVIAWFTIEGLARGFIVFISPIIEECLKHVRFNMPIVIPWLHPAEFFGKFEDLYATDLAFQVAVDRAQPYLEDGAVDMGFMKSWFWATRWLRCTQGYRRQEISIGLVYTLLICLVELSISKGLMQVLATVAIHSYCHLSSFHHAVLVHIVYNFCATILVFPTASLVRCGRHMVSAAIAVGLREFFRNGSSHRFPRVEPMGKDSQFREFAETPSCEEKFPLKDGVKEDLKVTRSATKGRNRLTVLMSVFVLAASFAANTSNVLHSVYGRVLAKVPLCTASTGPIVNKLDKISAKMGYVEPDNAEDWARKFPVRKRNRYLQALSYLAVVGFACFDDRLLGAKNHWDKRSCFLKHEVNLCQLDKVVYHDGRAYVIACADPRTIQASEDPVQCTAGPYFTAYGRRASEVFDGGPDSLIDGWRVCMAYGRTKSETARIIRQIQNSKDNGVIDCGDDVFIVWGDKCYAIDAKRWDAHVSATLLRLKARHLLALGMPQQIVSMLDRLIKRRGSYKGLGVRFELEGDVASGDPDTLYWNTTLGVALVLAAVDGCTTFEQFSARCTEWGIEYELAAVGSRSEPQAHLDFCSCIFVPTATDWTLAPKFGRSIMKLAYTANSGNPAELLSSKVMGLSYDLSAYPDAVTILRKLLPDLPNAVAAQESYVPVGKVEPATRAELNNCFRARYGESYDSVLDDLNTLVERTKLEQMESGDLVVLQKCVSVDYGKQAMAGPLPAANVKRHPYTQRKRTPVWPGIMALLLVGRVGLNLTGKEARFISSFHGKGRQCSSPYTSGWWAVAEQESKAPRAREEEGAREESANGTDHRQWSLHDRRNRSQGAQVFAAKSAEGNVCERRREAWSNGWEGACEYYWGGRLRLQRYRSHAWSSNAQWISEAADLQLRVRNGSDIGGRVDVQSENTQSQSLRDRGVSLDEQDRNAVHQIQVRAASIRVPIKHVRLRSERAFGHRHFRPHLQRRGGTDVLVEAADGGSDSRSVNKAIQQHHVWNRVRRQRRPDALALGSESWRCGDKPHRPWRYDLRNLWSAADGGNEIVTGRDLGSLYGRVFGPHSDGGQFGVQWRRSGSGHVEQHAGPLRQQPGRSAERRANGRRSSTGFPDHGAAFVWRSRTTNGRLFHVERQLSSNELVDLEARHILPDGNVVFNIGDQAKRSRADVYSVVHGRLRNSGDPIVLGRTADGAQQRRDVPMDHHDHSAGFENHFRNRTDVHKLSDGAARRHHGWHTKRQFDSRHHLDGG